MFNRFRKHSFDLDNPIIVDSGAIGAGFEIISFTKFQCTRCSKTLALDRWQMNDLPRSMSHGCNPSSNQYYLQ